MFKVGDKVRCLKDEVYYTKGYIYKVWENETNTGLVGVLDNTNGKNRWLSENFELVEKANLLTLAEQVRELEEHRDSLLKDIDDVLKSLDDSIQEMQKFSQELKGKLK